MGFVKNRPDSYCSQWAKLSLGALGVPQHSRHNTVLNLILARLATECCRGVFADIAFFVNPSRGEIHRVFAGQIDLAVQVENPGVCA